MTSGREKVVETCTVSLRASDINDAPLSSVILSRFGLRTAAVVVAVSRRGGAWLNVDLQMFGAAKGW